MCKYDPKPSRLFTPEFGTTSNKNLLCEQPLHDDMVIIDESTLNGIFDVVSWPSSLHSRRQVGFQVAPHKERRICTRVEWDRMGAKELCDESVRLGNAQSVCGNVLVDEGVVF